jgi:hypothetical protein
MKSENLYLAIVILFDGVKEIFFARERFTTSNPSLMIVKDLIHLPVEETD